MATNIPCCLFCAAAIPNCKDRWNISYGEGLKVKETIRELLTNNCASVHDHTAVELYMKSLEVVCKKKCFSLIAKLNKLTQDIKAIRDELEKTVQSSYSHFSIGRNFGSLGIHRKRSNPRKTPTPSKRLRRENANTPTRQFLGTTMTHGEPAIAVMSTS